MKPRLPALFLLTAAAALLPPVARAQATNPPYLSQFPPAQRIQTEVKGTDPMETAARQLGAYWQLRELVYDLAWRTQRRYRTRATADENRIAAEYDAGYAAAFRPYESLQKTKSHPDWLKWSRMRTSYENNPEYLDELLRQFFPAEFRAGYYRVTGKRPPQPVTAPPPSGPPSAPAGGGADAYLAEGDKYRKAGEYAKALEAYKKAISLGPSAAAYNKLGNVYSDGLKQHENALAAYQQAVRLKPDEAVYRLNLGGTYIQAGQYESAVPALREALRLKPDFALAAFQLGIAYYRLENYPEAAEAYQRAIRLAPNEAAYRYDLGMTYIDMGRKEEAVEVHRALEKLDQAKAKELGEEIKALTISEDEDPMLELDYGNFMKGQPQMARAALRVFRRIILRNKDPQYVGDAYYQIADIYAEQEKTEKTAAALQQAVTFYQQALRVKPDNTAALDGLGYAYLYLGRKEEALHVYRRLLTQDKQKAQQLYAAINKKK